jgi:AcrR family transcriptional regulator
MSENGNTCDRRTAETRKAIINALADLLFEKELHKVTVKEITEIADINRGTFYKHYLDVYDLYDKAEQDIMVDLGMLVLQLEELPSDQYFTHLINYIDDNRPIFRMMFSPNSTSKLRDRFNRILEGSLRQLEAEKKDKSTSDITLRYQINYRSRGCVSIIALWVRGDFAESKDFIIKMLTELDSNTEKFISKTK